MAHLVGLLQEALLLSVALSLPVVGIAAVASLIIAVVQAMTQVQDATIGTLPRLVAVALALAVAGPWMGSEIVAFTSRVLGGG